MTLLHEVRRMEYIWNPLCRSASTIGGRSGQTDIAGWCIRRPARRQSVTRQAGRCATQTTTTCTSSRSRVWEFWCVPCAAPCPTARRCTCGLPSATRRARNSKVWHYTIYTTINCLPRTDVNNFILLTVKQNHTNYRSALVTIYNILCYGVLLSYWMYVDLMVGTLKHTHLKNWYISQVLLKVLRALKDLKCINCQMVITFRRSLSMRKVKYYVLRFANLSTLLWVRTTYAWFQASVAV